MLKTTALFALPLALALAGCVSDDQATAMADSSATQGAAPAPAPQTVAATTAATAPANWRTAKARAADGANAAAESLCVKAVQQQTNAEGVGVISSAPASTGVLVWLTCPASEAPWHCIYSNARVTEVGPVAGQG